MFKRGMSDKQKSLTFSRIIRSSFLWQFLMAAIMLGMAAFFVSSEHLELAQIRKQFLGIHPIYLLYGILLTCLYILLQGEMYVQSFKTVQWKLKLRTGVLLFLKRNLISVFLPAGGFSSLTFFSSKIQKRGANLSQISLASSIYALCGILTVVFMAVPVFEFLKRKK